MMPLPKQYPFAVNYLVVDEVRLRIQAMGFGRSFPIDVQNGVPVGHEPV
jgi:hypothetical protein